MMKMDRAELARFLVEAKRNTYAALGDDASVPPLLNGSKQLEYASGDFFYRDIYFGMDFFAGQEAAELAGRPVWSMVYSGGVTTPDMDNAFVREVYRFLGRALRQAELPLHWTQEAPGVQDSAQPVAGSSSTALYRGPERWAEGEWLYVNESSGGLERFHGGESIYLGGKLLYELRYSGGLLA